MKRLALACLAAALSFAATARDRYKILYINTPAITVGDSQLKVNDTFDDSLPIRWSSDRQAMKVVSTTTGRQLVLSAKRMNSQSVADYIAGSDRLSTRPGETLSLIDLRNSLTGTFYLLDYIDFPAIFPVDDARFFFAAYSRGGETVNKKLPVRDGRAVIDWDIWTVDATPAQPQATLLSVYYYDTVAGEVTLVSDALTVIPLDREL